MRKSLRLQAGERSVQLTMGGTILSQSLLYGSLGKNSF